MRRKRHGHAMRVRALPAAALWRLLAVLLTVGLGVLSVLPATSAHPFATSESHGVLAVAVVAAALLAGWALRYGTSRAHAYRPVAVTAPAGEERRLHGAFRPQSRPDAPGRPRPRAPGSARRPA